MTRSLLEVDQYKNETTCILSVCILHFFFDTQEMNATSFNTHPVLHDVKNVASHALKIN